MQFTIKTTDINKFDVDVLIFFSFENEPAGLGKLDVKVKEHVERTAEKEGFKGKEGQVVTVSSQGFASALKIFVIGLGKKDKLSLWGLYKGLSFAVRNVLKVHPKIIGLALPDFVSNFFKEANIYQAVTESVILTSYSFDKYKSSQEKDSANKISEVYIYSKPEECHKAEKGINRGVLLSEATNYARDLINEPSMVTTPTFLADSAKEIEKLSENKISVSILDRKQVENLGMGAFLGVAKGSDEPLKFITLRYKPENPKKKIALIGKGITFDTGGLSLKPPEHMETMKIDMSGAATVLGIFKTIDKIAPEIEVVGIIASCENMPSGKALKPGDILKTMTGKTIEVLNTDAEGRLTLADAIEYAVIKEKPDEIIDIATLTGSCVVALGQEIAGIWGNNENMLGLIEKAAECTGEKVWRMPLEEDYAENIKSTIADVKNIGTGRYGGSITAALFLEEFVRNINWIHMDIAGPAFSEKDYPLSPKGGKGFGVRLLLEYIASL